MKLTKVPLDVHQCSRLVVAQIKCMPKEYDFLLKLKNNDGWINNFKDTCVYPHGDIFEEYPAYRIISILLF